MAAAREAALAQVLRVKDAVDADDADATHHMQFALLRRPLTGSWCNICICIHAQLVSQQRSRLGGLWDALKMGEQERALYEAFEQQPTDLEEALHLHDAEIRSLRQRERETVPLLARIEEYSTLVRERDALKETTADASRLMARKTNSYVFRQVHCLCAGACACNVYMHACMHACMHTFMPTRPPARPPARTHTNTPLHEIW